MATDAMAVPAEEMLASIDEVAKQAKQSSDFALQAQSKTQGVAFTNSKAEASVLQLNQQLSGSRQALSQLYADVEGVETILEMIQDIDEQINLLALNAAIEAVRAGEHGRRVAFVADEVRALSGKTSPSADEIRSKIELLQSTVNKTGAMMEEGIKASEQGVEKSEQSKCAFEAILSDVVSIG